MKAAGLAMALGVLMMEREVSALHATSSPMKMANLYKRHNATAAREYH